MFCYAFRLAGNINESSVLSSIVLKHQTRCLPFIFLLTQNYTFEKISLFCLLSSLVFTNFTYKYINKFRFFLAFHSKQDEKATGKQGFAGC